MFPSNDFDDTGTLRAFDARGCGEIYFAHAPAGDETKKRISSDTTAQRGGRQVFFPGGRCFGTGRWRHGRHGAYVG
jgi:hypothetical protein